jgi:predicted DNA-binding protein
MIKKEFNQHPKRKKGESFKVTDAERATLAAMANDYGVPKAVLIREGLERIYQEYQSYKAAGNEESN